MSNPGKMWSAVKSCTSMRRGYDKEAMERTMMATKIAKGMSIKTRNGIRISSIVRIIMIPEVAVKDYVDDFETELVLMMRLTQRPL
jgi:hypothetical protein